MPSTESATADVIITADRGAVGTIAQAYCSQAQGYLHTVVEGEGQVVFADGITLAGYNRLKLRGGNALVSGGTVESRQKIYMFSGELAFTNSVMSFEGTGSSFELASEEQCGDARVVFRAGSSWNMGNNCIPSIGRVEGFESRLGLLNRHLALGEVLTRGQRLLEDPAADKADLREVMDQAISIWEREGEHGL